MSDNVSASESSSPGLSKAKSEPIWSNTPNPASAGYLALDALKACPVSREVKLCYRPFTEPLSWLSPNVSKDFFIPNPLVLLSANSSTPVFSLGAPPAG